MHWLSNERGGQPRRRDRARPMHPATLALAALACAWMPARAQRLELGAPPAPVLPRPNGLDELRDGLEAQERVFAARSAEARARASAALRTLARALLAEPAPPTRLVLGVTLASRLSALDRVIQSSSFHDAGAMLLARDALVLAGDLPEDQPELDRRLRDLLAELSRACGELPVAGWGGRSGGTLASADAARWATMLEPGAGGALGEVARALDDAGAWPVLDRGAAGLRAALSTGARTALEGPAWLSEGARASLKTLLEVAARGLTTPELRPGAIESLSVLERAAESIALAERLPAGDAAADARARLSSVLERSPAQAALATPLFTLALQREGLQGERAFVRPLRPAWRTLAQRARESEAALLAVLGRAIESGPSDPGVIGAIRSHRRSLEALAGLEALSRVCSEGAAGDDPAVQESWTRLAQAALDASRRIEGPENAERMLAFESLLAQAARIERLAGPSRLDLTPEEDSRLCGGRVDDLRRGVSACRAEWAREWSEQNSASAGTLARLAAMEGLFSAMDDARAWNRMVDTPGAATRMSAWELPGPALRLAGEDASEQLAETARLVLAGEHARAEERLARWREEYALVRLAARLERDAQGRGMTPGEPTPASAIAELGAGAPGTGAPLHARHRDELAAICRYAGELTSLRKAGAREQERQLRRFVQWKASALLEALGPETQDQVSSSASR